MVGAFKVYNIFKWRCSGLFNTIFKHMQQNIQPINLLFLFLTLNLTVTTSVDVIVVFLSLSLKNDLQTASVITTQPAVTYSKSTVETSKRRQ